MKDRTMFIKGVLVGLVVAIAMNILRVQVLPTSVFKGQQKYSIEEKVNTLTGMLDKYYVDDIDEKAIEQGVYKGLVESVGDPYTTYFSPDEFAEFVIDTDGSFSGVGVEVTMGKDDNVLTVITPIIGTPAERAGILPQDKIMKVNGDDISKIGMTEAVSKIRGENGDDVTLTIYRPSDNSTFDATMKREKIEVTSVAGEMLDNKIGYIRLSQFNKNTNVQFEETISKLLNDGMEGLIVDVRNNPGGLLTVVEDISDMLLPESTIVYTIDKDGKRVDNYSDAKFIDVPLCVMVNGNSASASEILSGAIQDNGRGTLVGTQTFGKGLVQGLYPLNDGSALKITIQKYYTPSGVCIQGTGITPDYVVDVPDEYKNMLTIPRDSDTQLKKAIEVVEEQIK